VGIETLNLHVIHDADGLDSAKAADEIERLRRRVRTAGSEPARPYRRLRDGDYHGTRALREDLLPGRTDLAIHLDPSANGARHTLTAMDGV
jgi:NAD(P)H dehydrogenase (quinone)